MPVSWAALLAIAITVGAGCNDDAPEPASEPLPPRAEQSIKVLPPAERAAGQALVRLEAAARRRDGDELCDSVYLLPAGEDEGCAETFRQLFPTENGYSLSVRSVAFSDAATARARARAVKILADGSKQSRALEFELVKRAGAWRVLFIT